MKIYVCSPLGAPTPELIRENMMKAREYIYVVEDTFPGTKAYAPHAWLPEILDDLDPVDRQLALDFGLQLLRNCDALFVCGNRVSPGMANEIRLASELNIPVYSFGTSSTLIAEQVDGFSGTVLPSCLFSN